MTGGGKKNLKLSVTVTLKQQIMLGLSLFLGGFGKTLSTDVNLKSLARISGWGQGTVGALVEAKL